MTPIQGKIFKNISKDFLNSFHTQKHHQSMILRDTQSYEFNLSRQQLLYDNEIQSENDKSRHIGYDNPFKIDQFLIETGKIFDSEKILDIAAKQAFYNLKRKGINYISTPKSEVSTLKDYTTTITILIGVCGN